MTLAMPPVVVFSLGSGRGAAPPSLMTTSTVSREFAFEQFLGLVFDFHCERVAGLGEAEYDGDFSGCRCDMLDKTAADDILPRFGMNERREQMSDFFFHICVVTFLAKITYIL